MLINYKCRGMLLPMGIYQSTTFQTKMENSKTNKGGKKIGYPLGKVNLSQVPLTCTVDDP